MIQRAVAGGRNLRISRAKSSKPIAQLHVKMTRDDIISITSSRPPATALAMRRLCVCPLRVSSASASSSRFLLQRLSLRLFSSGGFDQDKNSSSNNSSSKYINVGKIKNDGTTKRFYKNVSVEQVDSDCWTVVLDGKRIQTPLGHNLHIPSEPLAVAVAAEWDAQKQHIKPAVYMPLMSLVNTAIDNMPMTRLPTINSLVGYLNAESVLIHDAPESKTLTATKLKLFPPLVRWFENEFKVKLLIHKGVGLITPDQPEETQEAITKFLLNLDYWHLTAVSDLCAVLSSTVLGLSVYRGYYRPNQAVDASRVDEDDQIRRCGLIEEAHILPVLSMRVRVAAAATYLNFLPQNKPQLRSSVSATNTPQLPLNS